MNKFFLSTTLILTLGVFAPVMADDTADLASRLKLAKEYSQQVPVADEVKTTIDALAIQVPMDQRVIFRSVLERTIKADQLEAVSEMALAEVFTQEELQALVDFYATPEGQAARVKMPQYQDRLKPVLEQMIRNAVETFQKQTK
jgi:hypothetical protein